MLYLYVFLDLLVFIYKFSRVFFFFLFIYLMDFFFEVRNLKEKFNAFFGVRHSVGKNVTTKPEQSLTLDSNVKPKEPKAP